MDKTGHGLNRVTLSVTEPNNQWRNPAYRRGDMITRSAFSSSATAAICYQDDPFAYTRALLQTGYAGFQKPAQIEAGFGQDSVHRPLAVELNEAQIIRTEFPCMKLVGNVQHHQRGLLLGGASNRK